MFPQSNSPINCWPELSFRFKVVFHTIQKQELCHLEAEIADLNSHALIEKWTASRSVADTIK